MGNGLELRINNTYERYDYDHGERVTAIVGGNIDENGNDDGETYRISYGYDDQERSATKTYDVGDKVSTVTYEYNDKEQLSKVTLPDNSTLSYSYDNLARSTSRTHTIGTGDNAKTVTESYGYLNGANGNTTGIVETMSMSGLTGSLDALNYRYTYDDNGNITEIYEIVNGEEILRQKYEYDAQNQLTTEFNYTRSMGVKYYYSATGNLLYKDIYYNPPGSLYINPNYFSQRITYSYGNANWGDLLTSYNGKEITYDEIGNPLTYDGNTYDWTQGRRLAGISNDSQTITYEYNADGIRTSKTVNGVTTDYILEGSNIVYQTDGTNQLWFNYDAGGRLAGFTAKLGTSAEQTYYYTRNAQGDITGIYDDNGELLCIYRYGAWGDNASIFGNQTIAELNPFRYRGYYYDSETGYYYLNSRYYSPEWGRFINADGYVSTGQGLLSNNMFVYCLNNPVNRADPSGQIAVTGTVVAVLLLCVTTLLISSTATVQGTILSNPYVNTFPGNSIADPFAGYDGWVDVPSPPTPKVKTEEKSKAKEKSDEAVTTKKSKHPVIFPVDPNSFNPVGLNKVPRDGTKNGAIISWMDPLTNTEVFRWDENPNYSDGPHYHIYSTGHYYPGTFVPEPYATIYFPFR